MAGLSLTLLFISFLVAFSVKKLITAYRTNVRVHKIPTVGPSSLLLPSFFCAYKLFYHSREFLFEGYKKYYGSAFRLATMKRWVVVVSGSKLVDELRRVGDDQLSIDLVADEFLQIDYTLGKSFKDSYYHTPVVRGPLTRHFGQAFPEVYDEIAAAFADEIPATKDWIKMPVASAVQRIVSRSSNRLFVGLPLCRDPEYRDLNVAFTMDIVKAGVILNALPQFMRPIVARLFTNVSSKVRKAARLVAPLLQDRLKEEEEYGNNWPGRPNDLISWLLDLAPAPQRTVEDMTRRILLINFAAIHSTSMIFISALYHLASYPDYVPPLRAEVETIIKERGWTKSAIGDMQKLDSFLKETLRMTGISGLTMGREVLKDLTLSNGTTIPTGAYVYASAAATHFDEDRYPQANTFNGFRFYDMRSKAGEGFKHHAVTPTPDYMPFGYGKHSCPGRFFAVNEIKAMLAHVLVNYDVKFENERRVPPAPIWYAWDISPNSGVGFMFRERVPE